MKYNDAAKFFAKYAGVSLGVFIAALGWELALISSGSGQSRLSGGLCIVTGFLLLMEVQRIFSFSRFSPAQSEHRRKLTEKDHQAFLRAWEEGASRKNSKTEIPVEVRLEFERQFPARLYNSSEMLRSDDAEVAWQYYKYTEGR
jgi:hypothetical protein